MCCQLLHLIINDFGLNSGPIFIRDYSTDCFALWGSSFKTQMAWLVNDVLAFQMQNGFFPTSEQGLMALVEIPSGHPNPKIWKQLLKEVPLDPWGRPYILESPVTATPHGFQIRSHGANIDNEDDDIVVDDLAVKKKPRS